MALKPINDGLNVVKFIKKLIMGLNPIFKY